MGAARAVEEVEVGVDRLAVAGEADGQAPLHAVEEEGLVAVDSRRALHLLAGARGHEDLGLHAGHLHVGRVGHRGGHHPVFDEKHIGVELGPFVACPHQVDDAVEADGAAVGQGRLDQHHVIELEVLALGDAHPELERHRVEGAEDAAHGVAHAVASWCRRSSMARRTIWESPRRRRRCRSSPPMG